MINKEQLIKNDNEKVYNIVYYFDFDWTSTCEPEVLKSNLTYDEAEQLQEEYAEYFNENTFQKFYSDTDYDIEDAYEAYAIVHNDDLEEYLENIWY